MINTANFPKPKPLKPRKVGPKDLFVFTEIVRCGPIGKIALESFFAYHPTTTVHVYGTEADRQFADFPKAVFHSLDKPDATLEGWSRNPLERFRLGRRLSGIARNFDHGHLGTASLWAHLIQTRPEKFLLHFDSDVIFRAEALSDIITRLQKGYDLVGPNRNYKYNPHNDDAKRSLPDAVGTSFFAFNRGKISPHPFAELTKMCQGLYNPLGFAVLDFFDPVAFEMLHGGASLTHLPVDSYGGENERGGRENKYSELNKIVDFGDKMSHFSAVGSGLNFFQNRDKIRDVDESYVQYGLEKYAVYMKLFYQKDLAIKFDRQRYAPLFKVKRWY